MTAAPRFKHCYLHIGLDKTGTTNAQEAFAAKADALERQCNLHFPCTFTGRKKFSGNHSPYLRPLFCEFPRARRRLSGMGLHTEADIERYNRATLADLQQGFAATHADSVLFSAEVITHFQPEDLTGLAQWATQLAEKVTVIACVRHPEHALSSEIQQRLRIGAKLQNLYRNPPHHQLRDKFTALEAIFGAGAVRAYSFHRALEHPAGLATALLAELGIDSGLLFDVAAPANSSMSAQAAQQLDSYNREKPAFIEGVANPQRSAQRVRALAALPGEPFRAPPDVIQRVAELSSADINWMEEHFNIDLRYR
ncbi:hypothetical protein A3709_11070 [Halioglobus sp. HI00S01]|uniref:hypothetical protein n=1 Tax=Halioglobus sp. HI00S01 TaxID=1822214 RepID=UPI0007C36948|nr:hypothetical protein [Halioglobus sp. HI00S01]KZX51350.1 hypothetical protein A3709_11070 [Halioglobus sp. HI00S01]